MDLPSFHHGRDDVVKALESDLAALADAVVQLDGPVQLAGETSGAGGDYRALLDFYERAGTQLREAGDWLALAGVASTISDGLFLVARVQARVDGVALPDRRQPCFFDPRHGHAIGYIAWSPQGGEPRSVSVCAADHAAVDAEVQPAPRVFVVDDHEVPFWDAPRPFVSWFAGHYGSVEGCPPEEMLAGFKLGALLAEDESREGDDDGDGDGDVRGRSFWRDRWEAPWRYGRPEDSNRGP